MKYNFDIQHRRSIRLRGYDYSHAGAYFVTICSYKRECIFGEIHNSAIMLNEFGQIVLAKWNNIPVHFINAELDLYIIMPNHIHGIIVLNNIDVGAKHFHQKNTSNDNPSQNASPLRAMPHGTKPGSLSAIIQNFVSVSTRKMNQFRKTAGAKLWQRNFYEHIIRNEKELNALREYIVNNPLNWDSDENNPNNIKTQL